MRSGSGKDNEGGNLVETVISSPAACTLLSHFNEPRATLFVVGNVLYGRPFDRRFSLSRTTQSPMRIQEVVQSLLRSAFPERARPRKESAAESFLHIVSIHRASNESMQEEQANGRVATRH